MKNKLRRKKKKIQDGGLKEEFESTKEHTQEKWDMFRDKL